MAEQVVLTTHPPSFLVIQLLLGRYSSHPGFELIVVGALSQVLL